MYYVCVHSSTGEATDRRRCGGWDCEDSFHRPSSLAATKTPNQPTKHTYLLTYLLICIGMYIDGKTFKTPSTSKTVSMAHGWISTDWIYRVLFEASIFEINNTDLDIENGLGEKQVHCRRHDQERDTIFVRLWEPTSQALVPNRSRNQAQKPRNEVFEERVDGANTLKTWSI